MGGNKPFHPWQGTTLIEATLARFAPQTDDLRINAGDSRHPLAAELTALGRPVLFDASARAGRGPLSGVLTAIETARAEGHAFVITAPCDMPNLPLDMVARLMVTPDEEVVYFSGQRDHPLCARWSCALFDRLWAALEGAESGLPVLRFLGSCQVITLPTEDDAAFTNINNA